MRAGSLRQRVTIQSHVQTQDEYGEPIEAWSDLATVWAAVEPDKAREFFGAEQIQGQTTVRIRMRYRDDVTREMRAVHEGHVYDIQGVLHQYERHRELWLMCVERHQDGFR